MQPIEQELSSNIPCCWASNWHRQSSRHRPRKNEEVENTKGRWSAKVSSIKKVYTEFKFQYFFQKKYRCVGNLWSKSLDDEQQTHQLKRSTFLQIEVVQNCSIIRQDLRPSLFAWKVNTIRANVHSSITLAFCFVPFSIGNGSSLNRKFVPSYFPFLFSFSSKFWLSSKQHAAWHRITMRNKYTQCVKFICNPTRISTFSSFLLSSSHKIKKNIATGTWISWLVELGGESCVTNFSIDFESELIV